MSIPWHLAEKGQIKPKPTLIPKIKKNRPSCDLDKESSLIIGELLICSVPGKSYLTKNKAYFTNIITVKLLFQLYMTS